MKKPLEWVGDSLESLRAFPRTVTRNIGMALLAAQFGQKHPDAKPPRGFGGAGVLEIVENHDGNTYRAVYTVKLAGIVYVLHVFQKKAKRKIATPKKEVDLIKQRLKRAREHYREAYRPEH